MDFLKIFKEYDKRKEQAESKENREAVARTQCHHRFAEVIARTVKSELPALFKMAKERDLIFAFNDQTADRVAPFCSIKVESLPNSTFDLHAHPVFLRIGLSQDFKKIVYTAEYGALKTKGAETYLEPTITLEEPTDQATISSVKKNVGLWLEGLLERLAPG